MTVLECYLDGIRYVRHPDRDGTYLQLEEGVDGISGLPHLPPWATEVTINKDGLPVEAKTVLLYDIEADSPKWVGYVPKVEYMLPDTEEYKEDLQPPPVV